MAENISGCICANCNLAEKPASIQMAIRIAHAMTHLRNGSSDPELGGDAKRA